MALIALAAAGCAENTSDPFSANLIARLPIVVTDPANGAQSVDVRKVIVISFPADVDQTTLKEENLILQEGSRTVAHTATVDRSFTFDAGRREVSIFPRVALKPNTSYQVIVQGVRTTGQAPFETTAILFSTGSVSQPPTVRGQLRDTQNRLRPLADAASVDPRSSIELTFSRAMDPSSVTSAFSILPRVVGTFSMDTNNTRLVFTHPDNAFPLGQTFTVMVLASAFDASAEHVSLGTNFIARFSTPAVGLFQVVSSEPAQQTPPAQAQADTPVRLVFGEPVDVTSARQNIQFTPATASPVLTFTNSNQVVLITHANIAAGTAVTVTVSRNLLNSVGVPLGQATGGRDFVLNYTIESTPPKLTDSNPTVPANDQRNVAPNTTITFNFNERLDPNTVNPSTFTVTRGGNAIAGTVRLSPSGQSVIFTPSTTIQADPNPVVATATTGIRDLGGTAVATSISISFFIDSTGPALAFTDPADGSTEVAVNRFQTQPIVVDFSEAVDQAATRRGFSISPSRATTRTGANGVMTFGSATRMLYTTTANLLGNTQYTVRLSTQDLAGNPTPAPLTFAFTTDATPPQVNTGTLQPAPGALNQPRQPLVRIEFTELMDTGTVKNAFSLTSLGQTFGSTSGTFVFGESGGTPRRTVMTYTLNVGVQLPANAVVNINLAPPGLGLTNASDLGLNQLPTAFLSTFSTAP
ncbi:MAG: Ig-like domain-containing protein [Candidatus Riflebacteria bacterium]|nr:Ig-like domain-containing protein [Candidatus Riflebacteria bacterium]